MANQFWFRAERSDVVEGPMSAAELRAAAASGRLTAAGLVSNDNVNWYPAGRVKGLFTPAVQAPARQPATAAAPGSADEQAPPPVMTAPPGIPPSLGYYAPGATATGVRLRRRSVLPFTVIAVLMLGLWGILIYRSYLGQSPAVSSRGMGLVVGGVCGFLLLSAPALVLWLVWVHGVHKDLRALSEAQYSVTPGQAVGFSLIPFFDAFWVVYMPWRACFELNRHLSLRGLRRVSSGAVMACQIGSILCALLLVGLLPLCYAITMWQIQRGMNRLADAAQGLT